MNSFVTVLLLASSVCSSIIREDKGAAEKISEIVGEANQNHVINIEKDWLDDVDEPGRAIPGVLGRDFPVYATIPDTSFNCSDKNVGFYADAEADCQVWHYCKNETTKESHLCPNGTIYNAVNTLCEWWFNVDCTESASYREEEDYEEYDDLDDYEYETEEEEDLSV